MCETLAPVTVGDPSPKFHEMIASAGLAATVKATARSTTAGFGFAVGALKNAGSVFSVTCASLAVAFDASLTVAVIVKESRAGLFTYVCDALKIKIPAATGTTLGAVPSP